MHIQELVHENNMHASDIIAISKSRLNDTDRNEDYDLPGFHIHRFDETNANNGGRSYRGIVVYSKLEFIEIKKLFLSEDVETVLSCFCHNNKLYQVVFLYSSPQKTSLSKLCNVLHHLLNILDIDKPIIIMGDTNVDILNQNSLRRFLDSNSLQQLIQTSTTDYGSCLDHLYTNMKPGDEISAATLESYYSDHKPIVAYLPYT